LSEEMAASNFVGSCAAALNTSKKYDAASAITSFTGWLVVREIGRYVEREKS
jgi:hypothetical protein